MPKAKTKQLHKNKEKTTKGTARQSGGKKNYFSATQLQYLVILLISLLIYANTLFFGFALDDGLIITDNKVTKKGLAGYKEIFTKNAFYGVFGDQASIYLPGGRYRPMSQAMFAAEYQIFGLSPFAGHFFNIIIYGMLCLLLLKILKSVFEKYDNNPWYLSLPFVATILFACHPLHTEVVANIKGRDELLSLLGALATLYFAINYIKNQKFHNLLFIFLAFAFALLSKENAVTFFAVVPLAIFFGYNEPLKKYIRVLIPMLAAFGLYFLLRYQALGFIQNPVESKELLNNPFLYAEGTEKFATILFTWGKYLMLVLWPHPLTHDYYPYQIPIIDFPDIRALAPLIIYLALMIFSMVKIFSKNVFAFAILFFLITFSIASNLVFNIGTFMNERFMFAPLLGFTIVVAYGLNRYLMKPHRLTAATIFLVVLVSVYSVKTFSRNFAWKDSYTLFTTDVNNSPNSAKVNAGAGEMLLRNVNDATAEPLRTQTIEKAIGYLKKSVDIYPGFKSGWVFLGYAYHLQKDYENSRTVLEQALKLENNNSDAIGYLNSAALECYRTKNYKQSEANFKTLIRYVPDNTEYVYLLADLYANTGKPDTAIQILNGIIGKKPDYSKAYNKLGEIYGRIYGNFSKSVEYLDKAYALNPTDLETLRNLGTLYGLQGKFEPSLKYLLEAEKVKPDDKDILNKLSITYLNIGNRQKAEEYSLKSK